MEMNMEKIFEAIMAEDTASLLAMFENGHANLTMPSFGKVSSDRIFKMLVKKLHNRFKYLNVTCEQIKTTVCGSTALVESNLTYLFYDEERKQDLPYVTPTALLCTLGENGLISSMLVYTGFNAFVGKSILTPAMYNGDAAIAAKLPASVVDCYEKMQPKSRYELCVLHQLGDVIAVEDTALFTQGDICTPQAHMTVFEMDGDTVKTVRSYGEIVWDFKLWPTLY